MADPTGVPGQSTPTGPVADGPREASGEDPVEAAHLDPPGMPASEAPPPAPDGPGSVAPAQPAEEWLEGPPPSAEAIAAPPQEAPADGEPESSPLPAAPEGGGNAPSDAPGAAAGAAEAPVTAPPVNQATEAPPPRTSSGDREPPAFDFDFSTPAGDDEVVEAVEEGAPAWMMTFGDMMSLLLTFFILLFSMSSIEVEKFRAATESLAEALGESNAGIMPDGAVPITPPPAPVGEVRDQLVQERIDEVATQLEEFVRENNLEEQVVVSKESHGVFLRMQNQALFGQGSADIAAESVAIVEQLGAVLDRMDLPVKVSGHTDNVPIRSSVFPSNWELSAARAAGVARILVSRGHDPATVAVEAFGEYRPVASNDTPEGRAENRRVELYFSRLSMEQAMDEGGELPQEADGEGSAGGAP